MSTYAQRVTAIAATKPAAVIVTGGRNDLTYPPAQVAAAITDTFVQLRTALPHTPIIGFAPFWDDTTPPALLATIAADIKAATAAAAAAATYLDTGNLLVGHPEWVSPEYPDHPNDAGYAAMATAIEAAVPHLSVLASETPSG